jgi:hypothetical protein
MPRGNQILQPSLTQHSSEHRSFVWCFSRVSALLCFCLGFATAGFQADSALLDGLNVWSGAASERTTLFYGGLALVGAA